MTDAEKELCAQNRTLAKGGWWEGKNLHIINDKDEHIVFINCEVIEVPASESADGIAYFDFKARGKIQGLK